MNTMQKFSGAATDCSEFSWDECVREHVNFSVKNLCRQRNGFFFAQFNVMDSLLHWPGKKLIGYLAPT